MTPTEQHTQTPHTATRLVALLGGLRHANGTGTPPARQPHPYSRRSFAPLSLAAGCVVLLLTLVPSASANTLHAFSTEFGTEGHEAGQLSGPTDVAVNSTTHDVYVADPGNHRIDEFTATGEFVLAFGAHVEPLGGDVCTELSKCQAGTAGSAPGQFEAPTFVAVDNSGGESEGDVYVADTATKLVQKFTASGELVTAWGDSEPPDGRLKESSPENGPFGALDGVAVDTAGNLWVLAGGTEQLTNTHAFEFEQDGAFLQALGVGNVGPPNPVGIALDASGNFYFGNPEGAFRFTPGEENPSEITPGPPTGLAFDTAADEFYADRGTTITHFSSACQPAAGLCTPIESFGESHLTAGEGIAVDPTDATVFAADTAADRVVSFAKALEATTSAASNITATTATLSGTVNPEGSEVSECFFEYGEEQHAPCVETVGSGNAEVPVHADISGLQGGTSYHFHLVVGDATGVLAGEQQELTTSPVATISDLASGELTATTAVLSAKVNPHGLPVTGCRFEYATSTSYEHSVPCAQSEAQIGSGEAPVPVSATITGLEPNRTYHWRLVAEDENGKGPTASTSPDQTFIYSTATAQLPDGRQYELVTPPDKNGATIGALFTALSPTVSEDGQRVFAPSVQCFSGTESCNGTHVNEGAAFEFARTPGGWVTHPLSPPASQFAVNTDWSFGPEPGLGLFSMQTTGGNETFYARQPNGTFTPIGPIQENMAPGDGLTLENEYTLATINLSHIVYQGSAPLWPSIDPGHLASSLYEYTGTGNSQPTVVGLKDGAESNELVSVCGTELGGSNGLPAQNRVGSLSGDGRTVYFTAGPCSEGGSVVPARELYARIDESRTEAISEPSPNPACTTPECLANTGPSHAAQYRDSDFSGASGDGSRVFFTSTQQLSDNATEAPAAAGGAFTPGCTLVAGTGCNLYESECPNHCENPGERKLIDVSAGDSSGGGPRVQGAMAVSSDGSHVYFVAKGVLTSTPNSEGHVAQPGQENLYAFQHTPGVPDHLAFIGRLSETDSPEWEKGGVIANVTPDGRYLVFTSSRALTADQTTIEGPAQVFRYDAQTGSLVRVSIGEEGYNDNGNNTTNTASILPAARGFGSVPVRMDPTMSNDGAYVFFESATALTSNALAEGGQNIYEYHEGQVALISDGKDIAERGKLAAAVELIGSDATGSNVFFSTTDPLVSQDTDTQRDFYDAHICNTTEPCLTPPTPPAEPCHEETCHGLASTGAPAGNPASSTLVGAGNLAPAAAASPVKPKPKALTRAQKLTKALKVCRTKHNRRKRQACEKTARKLYGPATKKARHATTTRRAGR